jgi:type II secretory pathway component HofQ
MDVPGLNWLFKRDGKSNSKEDLLIFITPTILKPQGTPAGG